MARTCPDLTTCLWPQLKDTLRCGQEAGTAVTVQVVKDGHVGSRQLRVLERCDGDTPSPLSRAIMACHVVEHLVILFTGRIGHCHSTRVGRARLALLVASESTN